MNGCVRKCDVRDQMKWKKKKETKRIIFFGEGGRAQKEKSEEMEFFQVGIVKE